MEAPTIDPMPMIAPLYIANSLNWLLLGAFVVQCYYYSQNFAHDKLRIRLIVYTFIILELAQTATTTHQAWWYGVTNWNNPAALFSFPWSACTVPIMAGIIAALAQMFYAWRIWSLSRLWFFRGMTILIVLVALLQSLTAIVASGIFQANANPALLLQLHPEFELWIAASFVADVLIAGSMMWILLEAKNHSVWERSRNLIGNLVVTALGTGLALAICGALTLALFATTVGASFQYLPAAYIWGKLYSNSVMVTLNSRKTNRANLGGGAATSMPSQTESYPMRIHVSRSVLDDGVVVSKSRVVEPTWNRSQDGGDDKHATRAGFPMTTVHDVDSDPFHPSKIDNSAADKV